MEIIELIGYVLMMTMLFILYHMELKRQTEFEIAFDGNVNDLECYGYYSYKDEDLSFTPYHKEVLDYDIYITKSFDLNPYIVSVYKKGKQVKNNEQLLVLADLINDGFLKVYKRY